MIFLLRLTFLVKVKSPDVLDSFMYMFEIELLHFVSSTLNPVLIYLQFLLFFQVCQGIICSLVGRKLPDVQIVDIKPWVMHAEVAERFDACDGRVILAGDAAHRFPPAGGFGKSFVRSSSYPHKNPFCTLNPSGLPSKLLIRTLVGLADPWNGLNEDPYEFPFHRDWEVSKTLILGYLILQGWTLVSKMPII